MSTVAAAANVADIRSRVAGDHRVSLSEFTRGKAWRAKLAENAFMEVQDHSERIGWLISEEGMAGFVEYVSELEDKVERAELAAIAESRRGYEDWRSGTDGAEAAKAYFAEHEAEFMEAVDAR
ncbi:MAG: hypothetical protein IJ087_01935 [Eggerthellaceae bacterium]|nr:hypothetical protein [Eggerthellaceae bacterium]